MAPPLRSPEHRRRRHRRTGDALAVALGLAALGAVLIAGIADGSRTVPVTAVVVAPLLTGIIASPRATAIVAAASGVAAVALSAIDDLSPTTELPSRLVVVVAVAAAAVVLSTVRVRREADLAATEQAHEADLRAMFAGSAVGMMLLDASGTIADVNGAMTGLLGIDRAELLGHPAGERVHPDDRDPAERARLLSGEIATWRGDLRLRHDDDEWRWVRLSASHISSRPGEAPRILLQLIDISADKQSEAELEAIIASLREAIIVYDGDGTIRALNPAARDLYGLPTSAIEIGRPLPPDVLGRIVDEDGEVVPAPQRALEQALTGRSVHEVVRGYDHPDGRRRWYSVSTDTFRLRGEERILVSMIDITDRHNEQERLHHQVRHDALTGLPNRVALTDHLAAAAAGTGRGLAVVFVDLDGFKAINDDAGHDVGDQVLVHVAQRLREALRPGDLACRYAGDEFVAVCRDCPDEHDAEQIALRLLHAIAEPVTTRAGELRPRASIGAVVTALPSAHTAGDLLRRADAAMYAAKERGRGRAVVEVA